MSLIPHSVTRAIGRKVLTTKKNSPHIFFVGGVIGVVGGAVMACRATLKLEKTIDEIHTDIESVRMLNENHPVGPNYTEQDYYKDLLYVYTKSAVKIGKLYGPSIAVGTISITALTGSHIQMTRRNAALTATLAAVSKAYDEYRIRVQNEIGVKRERDLYLNVTDEELENEKGKKQLVKVAGIDGRSPYSRIFDDYNPNWTKDPEYNRIFLECQQNYANQKLQARGHLFLNEVYDWLGLERSQEGQVVGWVYGCDKDSDGDGYVDFGIYEAYNSGFVLGNERSLILDFNVDGVVFDKI